MSYRARGLIILFVYACFASMVGAQEMISPGPIPPPHVVRPCPSPGSPNATPWFPGIGYFTSAGCPQTGFGKYHVFLGAKWRRGSAEFNSDPQPLSVSSTVVVPFGPTTDGPVNYTGEVWTYWNGSFINPFNPNATLQDLAWTPASGPLGHNNNPPIPQNVGSFGIIDPASQGVPPETRFNNIGSVTFQLLNVGSTISMIPGESEKNTRDINMWSPYLEFGYQYSDSFDLFLGLSRFAFKKEHETLIPYSFEGSVLNAVDRFTFISNNGTAQMPTPFLSTAIGGPGQPDEALYQIDPASGLRSFVVSAVQGSLGSVTQQVTSNLDVTMYELRAGARPWIRRNDFGRFFASVGPLLAYVPYQISTSALFTSANNTNVITRELLRSANRVLRQIEEVQNGRWWTFGGFASVGLELAAERWFVMSEVGYDAYFTSTRYRNESLRITFNPSGLSLTLGGGLLF